MRKTIGNNKLYVVGFILLLGFGILHEIVSLKVSEKEYYKGTVVEKTVSIGRTATHYLYINWDGIGFDSIVVHPITYKMTEIGDRFSTQWHYTPVLGASGAAYTPNVTTSDIIFHVSGILSKLLIIIGGFRVLYFYINEKGK